MARSGTAISDVLGIEDEVWQEAFTRRIPRRRGDEGPLHRESNAPRIAPVVEASPAHAAGAPQPVPAEHAPRAEPRMRAAAAPVSPIPTPVSSPPPERRTVTIKGRGAERHLPWPGDEPRRRPARPLHERAGFRPDRLAMWAMFLGLLLVLVAVLSSHG